MIRIEGLRHRILDIPDLVIGAGRTAVIGPNGSGKTTLLELCAGMETPESGAVTLHGRPRSALSIGWVSEFPDRTMLFSRVYDEIAAPLRFCRLPCPKVDARVRQAAEALGIRHLLSMPLRDLSGGEKALVAFAAAVIRTPDILVLDEVDSHLDEEALRQVLGMIRDAGIPLTLICTQNMDAASEADSVLYVVSGTVRHQGSPEDVFPLLSGTCFYPPLWRLTRCR
ncbi:MAG: energy-coupling factor ABC transporter ATP-binding protein [Methanomicrobiaceae archaeon]|uniref:Atpase component biom of energizing module of biotin ecf transporter n=1 Tax=hydrocarbon metagenome TaxID=938273 RepID=A0A0W8FDQ9_9ZZZZ|nr:energy-coupling factor ABC transporter ATP-binding protein [Methanomicrobiaceae archaeon]MDD5420009.1 energy-coupling factor ABC transporter ATP-binding protein [Methanomicrobiaceae archaeon]